MVQQPQCRCGAIPAWSSPLTFVSKGNGVLCQQLPNSLLLVLLETYITALPETVGVQRWREYFPGLPRGFTWAWVDFSPSAGCCFLISGVLSVEQSQDAVTLNTGHPDLMADQLLPDPDEEHPHPLHWGQVSRDRPNLHRGRLYLSLPLGSQSVDQGLGD